MLTRAIITDVDLTVGKVQVRIPWIDGIENSTVSPMSNQNLSWASIVCIPGIEIDYQVGDIVIVGFEDNNVGKPIVIGYLKLSMTDMPAKAYVVAKELTVEESLNAPTNTNIGDISYNDLYNNIIESN